METDEDARPNATLASSPYHVPGTFPDSTGLPRLPSIVWATQESQASDGWLHPNVAGGKAKRASWGAGSLPSSMGEPEVFGSGNLHQSGWGNCTRNSEFAR